MLLYKANNILDMAETIKVNLNFINIFIYI